MHHHTTSDWTYWMNLAANLVIVAGYVLVPFTVLRHLPLTWSVRISGSFFFGLCSVTHLAMAFGVEHNGLMLANHVAQAAAVIWFVLAFYRLLRAADTRRCTGGDRGPQ